MNFSILVAILSTFVGLAISQDQSNFYNVAAVDPQQQQQQQKPVRQNQQRSLGPLYYNNDPKGTQAILLRGPNANSILIGADGSIVSSQATSGYVATAGRVEEVVDDQLFGPLAYKQYMYPTKFNLQYFSPQKQALPQPQPQQQQQPTTFEVDTDRKF